MSENIKNHTGPPDPVQAKQVEDEQYGRSWTVVHLHRALWRRDRDSIYPADRRALFAAGRSQVLSGLQSSTVEFVVRSAAGRHSGARMAWSNTEERCCKGAPRPTDKSMNAWVI